MPFSGNACERFMCPGGLTNECNLHGRCMSMRELALEATSNGDAAPVVYGSDPNSGHTWDADRVFGCACDDGWTGYDCSLRACKTGDDPNTYGQVNEVMLFECAGTDGTFRVTFRRQTTEPIAFNASRPELEAALEALTTITDVVVLFSSGNSTWGGRAVGFLALLRPSRGRLQPRCRRDLSRRRRDRRSGTSDYPRTRPRNIHVAPRGGAATRPRRRHCKKYRTPASLRVWVRRCTDVSSYTNAVTVAFVTEHGPLPDLTADTSTLYDSNFGDEIGGGEITFFVDGAAAASDSSLVSVVGTTEDIECSGRGLCDRDAGSCVCFDGYTSSDGVGGPGAQDDCGHRKVCTAAWCGGAATG